MYIYQPTNQTLRIGRHFFDENGRRHAKEWFNWSEELKAQVGVVEVPDPVVASGPKPDHNEYCERVYDDGAGNWAVTDYDFEVAQDKIKSAAAQKCKTLRDGGLMFNGLKVSTDTNARGLLNGARNDRRATRKVVTSSGRAELTSAQFNALVDAVEDFIQSCFEREFDIQEAVDTAQTIDDLKAIDVTAGWPDNGVLVEPILP